MSFGERYRAQLFDGSTVALRPPDLTELNELMPAPEEVWSQAGFDPGSLLRHGTADALMETLEHDPMLRGWGIEHEGRMVGITGLEFIEGGYPGGFTYVLDPTSWNRGIGTCARTIVAHDAFTRDKCYAVTADVKSNNIASIRMLQKIGFQHIPAMSDPEGAWYHYLLPDPGSLHVPSWIMDLTPRQALQARITFSRLFARYAVVSG